jgi:hypothetical protein
MSEGNWLRREDPERTGPIRNFSGLYQSSANGNSDKASDRAGSNRNEMETEKSHEEGVGLAYRVIEKHINEGKKNAEQFNSRPYNATTLTDGLQEVLERTIRSQMELLPMWINALNTAIRLDPARTGYPPGFQPFPPRAEANGTAAKTLKGITIEVASARPVQASIQLQEGVESSSLRTYGLHTLDQNKPPLMNIVFAPMDGTIKVGILIPDGQPAGLYSGVIVDSRTGEARGTLSVAVAE